MYHGATVQKTKQLSFMKQDAVHKNIQNIGFSLKKERTYRKQMVLLLKMKNIFLFFCHQSEEWIKKKEEVQKKKQIILLFQ